MSLDESVIRTLVAKDRFHELEMAYCRGVDRRDPELLRSIFFDDAIEEHGDMYRGPADGFVEWVFSSFIGTFDITCHYVLNEWYRVDGEHGEGESYRISYHRTRDEESSAGVERTAACRTFTRYECRDEVWKIAHRSVVRDWIMDHPLDVSLLAGDFAMEMSRPDATDRSYRDLSLFARGPVDPLVARQSRS